jgi:hypothetical protein
MKKTKENQDLETDDEALREAGMTTGPVKLAGMTLRPVSILSMSWINRRGLFSEDFSEPVQQVSAFVYLHAAPEDEILDVVNDHSAFMRAVDKWMPQHFSHHEELFPFSSSMEKSINEYRAARTKPMHPSDNTKTPGKQ